MITFFTILYQPKKTFQYLYDQPGFELNKWSSILLIIYGFSVEVNDLFTENTFRIKGIDNMFFSIFFSLIISLLTFRYLFTYLIFFISKLLKGKGEPIDIRVVLAYALIPIILTIPLEFYAGLKGLHTKMDGIAPWVVYYIKVFAWMSSTYILTAGLVLYNQYTWVKGTINSSLMWLPVLIIYIYSLM